MQDCEVRPACRVLIAVPFYRNAHLVAPLFDSLHACAADFAAVCAEIVCYDDSPDDPLLAASLQEAVRRYGASFNVRIESNAVNLGFVRTMNRAVQEAVARGTDLVMLNSDTAMEPGALPEMLAVAALDRSFAFVNPRSNNATIATLKLRDPPEARSIGALARYQALSGLLPRFSFVPTCVGFCMLVRWAVLAEFGGFDEIYGQGYNEENDLVMRAGRCGYRAVLANHAFVWHEGETSFGTADTVRDTLEPRNRAILDARYPEYSSATRAHYSAPETIAEQLLAATLPDAAGMRDVAFDFSSFRAAHNGTFEAGRQLLQWAHRAWGTTYRVHVLCVPEVYEFHRYADLGIPRADPHGNHRFAAVFRVGQPYDWNVLERLAPAAAVLGIYMLDTISIDCPPLASPVLNAMWQLALDHADVIATQSTQTRDQFRTRFTIPPRAIELVAHHSLDLGEYRLPGSSGGAAPADGTILVIGNHFHHKFLNPTCNALAAAFPARTIVALGPDLRGAQRAAGPLDPPPLAALPHLRIVQAGGLAASELGAAYEAALVIVFPSHAEGFGFPVLHALAAHRPVLVRRLPVFGEIRQALGDTPNLHLFDSTQELIGLLRDPPGWVPQAAMPEGNGAERAALQIRDAMVQALARVNQASIVRRIRAVQLASALSAPQQLPAASDTKAAEAARFLALKVERVALRLFRIGGIYAGVRLAFHALRVAWRATRSRRLAPRA